MRDAQREGALLQFRALEPSVDRRQVTTHVDGHLAREARLGPSAKAVINIAVGVCCSRGDRRGGSEAASRGHGPIRLKPDPTGHLVSQRALSLRMRCEMNHDNSPPRWTWRTPASSVVESPILQGARIRYDPGRHMRVWHSARAEVRATGVTDQRRRPWPV